MSIYAAYDSEFTAISQDIESNIHELKTCGPNEDTSTLIRTIDGLFSQLNELLKQMQVEVRSNDISTRKVMLEKVDVLKKSMSASKKDYAAIKERCGRSLLMGSNSLTDRQRFLNTNEKLDRQNEMIANAHRSVLESEEVGLVITEELTRNREKLESSASKASEFAGITDTARRLLSNMSRRNTRQRWLTVLIVVLLIVAFSLAIYYGTSKK